MFRLIALCMVLVSGVSAFSQTSVAVFPSAADTVFAGAQRTIYSNVCAGANSLGCTPAANYNVSWTTDCAGSIDTSYDNSGTQKYVRFTAPAAPATCHVTATAADGSGAKASATFKVVADAPTVALVPFNITLYAGQYAILQPEVFGTTNLNVKWQIAGPVTSGVLTPTTQQAVFMSTKPGLYQVTATTVAAGSSGPATSTAFVTVTANAMPQSAVQTVGSSNSGVIKYSATTEPVDCSVPADPNWNVYEVYSDADLDGGVVDWSKLGAANVKKPGRGELIRLHYNNVDAGHAYHIQTVLGSSSGLSSKYPIWICGVADPVKGLPVWTGAGARSAKVFTGTAGRPVWAGVGNNSSVGGLQQYAVLNINDHAHSWMTNQDPNGYYVVEGILFTQAAGSTNLPAGQSGYKYTAYDGTGSYEYAVGAAGIRIGNGHDVVIRGNAFVDLGNGMLTKDSLGRGARLISLLVQGNYFGGNGTTLGRQHQAYVEATGTVVEFNHFAQLRPGIGASSNALKTRCLRCYVRFNHFEEGAHILDAVEPEDLMDAHSSDFLTTSPDLTSWTMTQVAGWEEAFNSAYWFYGNTIKDTISTNPVLFGGDTTGVCPDAHLYYYNNSLWEAASATPRAHVTLVSSNYCDANANHGGYSSVDAMNSVFWFDQKGTAGPSFLWAFTTSIGDRVSLGKNWYSYGWCSVEGGANAGQCGKAVGGAYGATANPIYKVAQSFQSAGAWIRSAGFPATGSTLGNRTAPFSVAAGTTFAPQSSTLLTLQTAVPSATSALPANFALDPNTGVILPRQLSGAPLHMGALD
ncbi:MAG: hypothetical protein NVS9B15_01740 [Acidobacteriaceae bacterium]